jgi:hypothetical protein
MYSLSLCEVEGTEGEEEFQLNFIRLNKIIKSKNNLIKRNEGNPNVSHLTQAFAEPFPPRDLAAFEVVVGGDGSRSVSGVADGLT